MEKNSFFKNRSQNKLNLSINMLKDLHKKMMASPHVPDTFKNKSLTPERAASDYIEYLRIGRRNGDYYQNPLSTHEFEREGKLVKLNLEQIGLSDYEISYDATRATAEMNNEVIFQTTMANNAFSDLNIPETMEYVRVMYGDEAFDHLMKHTFECFKDLPLVPSDASYDGKHSSNALKFKRAFKKDDFAKKMLKEVTKLNNAVSKYNCERKPIDVINDSRREEFENSLRADVKPVNSKTITSQNTRKTEELEK